MIAYWPTYIFLIGFIFVLEFGVSRGFGRPFSLRRTLIQCVAATIGLTIYFAILAA
ncbi:MAG: hypothetical protein AAF401_10530 [Pseudomonadota bacterium]